MNILPLILALVLILSLLTIEKFEKFKNESIVQKEYQHFLQMSEGQVFNKRQKRLYGESDKTLRQLSFRFLIDKNARDEGPHVAKQHRMLILELMKIVYGEATFYKELEQERPNFLEELLDTIQRVADEAPEKMIRGIEDIARLNLGDPKLQKAFYHMLKGTMTREHLEEVIKEKKNIVKEKAYLSLFTFIHYNGKKGDSKIVVQRAPREILKAIFIEDDIVNTVIAKRNELSLNKTSGSAEAFKSEFNDKRRPGLEDSLLDFSISEGDKSDYD